MRHVTECRGHKDKEVQVLAPQELAFQYINVFPVCERGRIEHLRA